MPYLETQLRSRTPQDSQICQRYQRHAGHLKDPQTFETIVGDMTHMKYFTSCDRD